MPNFPSRVRKRSSLFVPMHVNSLLHRTPVMDALGRVGGVKMAMWLEFNTVGGPVNNGSAIQLVRRRG